MQVQRPFCLEYDGRNFLSEFGKFLCHVLFYGLLVGFTGFRKCEIGSFSGAVEERIVYLQGRVRVTTPHDVVHLEVSTVQTQSLKVI